MAVLHTALHPLTTHPRLNLPPHALLPLLTLHLFITRSAVPSHHHHIEVATQRSHPTQVTVFSHLTLVLTISPRGSWFEQTHQPTVAPTPSSRVSFVPELPFQILPARTIDTQHVGIQPSDRLSSSIRRRCDLRILRHRNQQQHQQQQHQQQKHQQQKHRHRHRHQPTSGHTIALRTSLDTRGSSKTPDIPQLRLPHPPLPSKHPPLRRNRPLPPLPINLHPRPQLYRTTPTRLIAPRIPSVTRRSSRRKGDAGASGRFGGQIGLAVGMGGGGFKWGRGGRG